MINTLFSILKRMEDEERNKLLRNLHDDWEDRKRRKGLVIVRHGWTNENEIETVKGQANEVITFPADLPSCKEEFYIIEKDGQWSAVTFFCDDDGCSFKEYVFDRRPLPYSIKEVLQVEEEKWIVKEVWQKEFDVRAALLDDDEWYKPLYAEALSAAGKGELQPTPENVRECFFELTKQGLFEDYHCETIEDVEIFKAHELADAIIEHFTK